MLLIHCCIYLIVRIVPLFCFMLSFTWVFECTWLVLFIDNIVLVANLIIQSSMLKMYKNQYNKSTSMKEDEWNVR